MTSDVWVLDLERGIPERWTNDINADLVPVWSPDGRQMVFTSNRAGTFDLYVSSAPFAERPLVELESGAGSPNEWSRDGRWILYEDGGSTWSVPMLDGQPNGDGVLYRRPARQGAFSPDGNWVAYTSNESGRDQVYIDAFPLPASPIPVSGLGGSAPVWRGDGSELFYIDADGMLTAVPVTYTPSIRLGSAVPLFPAPSALGRHPYESSEDGQRFLFGPPGSDTITVVLNWMSGIDE